MSKPIPMDTSERMQERGVTFEPTANGFKITPRGWSNIKSQEYVFETLLGATQWLVDVFKKEDGSDANTRD